MRKRIGIVSEGPTDYMLLKELIDEITKCENSYFRLQPDESLAGKYGNGWKGVWKWCIDNAAFLDSIFTGISPNLDLLLIHLDGDVSRKEKEVHCLCDSTICEHKYQIHPLECEIIRSDACPIELPCHTHANSIESRIDHLSALIQSWLEVASDRSALCIAIPCDSTDSWVLAAHDGLENSESIDDPWVSIIAHSKEYHGIRIPGHSKSQTVYRQLIPPVCENWDVVKRFCISAKVFEDALKAAWNGHTETLHLKSSPGMSESIKSAHDAPADERLADIGWDIN